MAPLHSLLRRQVHRVLKDEDAVSETLWPLLTLVDQAYRQSDLDRATLERALDLSSQELVQANSDMRGMLQAFPDIFFRLRSDGTIVDQRGGGRAGSRHLVGKRVQDVPVPGLGQRFAHALAEAIRTQAMVSLEYPYAQDGGETWFEARLVPLCEGDVVMLVRDITERRRLHEQLVQAQKMEAVGRLAGGVAHDFNNLLTSILGFSELVLDELADGRARGHVEEIRRAGERAAELTRQLLAFSRKQVLQPKRVCVNDTVADMLAMLRRLIGEDVRLVTRLAPSLSCVRADPGQLGQVILNLVVNARDAMPGGGRIVIETREVNGRAPAEAGGTASAAEDHVVLTVRDDGCGMDAETTRQIFEPFFTSKEVGKGTGLGLATVYGIVRQSGGEIRVDSAPGEGTLFEIWFPVVEGPPQTTAAPTPVAALQGEETVLVVEDEDQVRTLACQALSSHGYYVLEARTGNDAVRLAGHYDQKIGLLLADVVLPDLSGPAVAAILHERRPDLKVLFMSGHADGRNGGGPMLDPDAMLLHKPFTPSRLLDCVNAVITAGRLAEDVRPTPPPANGGEGGAGDVSGQRTKTPSIHTRFSSLRSEGAGPPV